MNKTNLNDRSFLESQTNYLQPLPKLPKKLLCSKVWKSRNDSSNLNAILHPDTHNTPRMKYNEKTKGNVTKKFCLGSNKCYCREKCGIPRPSLIPRPATCVSKSTMGNKISIQDLKRSSLSCICSGKDRESKGRSLRERILKMKEGKTHQYDVELEYTDQRLNYEQYREEEEDKYLQEIENYRQQEEFKNKFKENEQNHLKTEGYDSDKEDKQQRILDEEAFGTNAEIRTLLGTQTYETRSSTVPASHTQSSKNRYSLSKNIRPHSSKLASVFDHYYLPENKQLENFKNPNDSDTQQSFSDYSRYQKNKSYGDVSETVYQDLPKFRNEHFFETHDIGRMGQPSEDHTCIHQFILDERMLPEPLNKDVFGRSLCKICQKLMEESSNIDKAFFGPSYKPTNANIRNLAKCAEYGLSPKPVHIGTGKSKIELILGKNDLDHLSTVVQKLKRTEYRNSLALRQQKMRRLPNRDTSNGKRRGFSFNQISVI